MWVLTQARKSDGQTFLVNLEQLGVISLTGPELVEGENVWSIVASDKTTSWTLAWSTSHPDALAIHRRVYNSLATGEKAINMNSGRKAGNE